MQSNISNAREMSRKFNADISNLIDNTYDLVMTVNWLLVECQAGDTITEEHREALKESVRRFKLYG